MMFDLSLSTVAGRLAARAARAVKATEPAESFAEFIAAQDLDKES